MQSQLMMLEQDRGSDSSDSSDDEDDSSSMTLSMRTLSTFTEKPSIHESQMEKMSKTI